MLVDILIHLPILHKHTDTAAFSLPGGTLYVNWPRMRQAFLGCYLLKQRRGHEHAVKLQPLDTGVPALREAEIPKTRASHSATLPLVLDKVSHRQVAEQGVPASCSLLIHLCWLHVNVFWHMLNHADPHQLIEVLRRT